MSNDKIKEKELEFLKTLTNEEFFNLPPSELFRLRRRMREEKK